MPAIRTSFLAEDFLSEDVRGAIHRRIREIGGIGLLAIAAAAAMALASWSVQDPSLSHATAAPVRNLLGALAATAFASSLPASRAWPLPTGLGGVIGDALLRIPASLMHAPLSGALRIAIGGATGMAAMVALAFSMGLGWRDRIEGEPEDAASDPAAEEEDGPAPRARRRARSPARTGTKRSRSGFELPSLSLLTAPKSSDRTTLSAETIQENATALESVLADFGVRGEIINAHPGPVVTLYELEP